MSDESPWVIIVAGPNGAGKSSTAPFLLQRFLGVRDYVNADVIAQGLSAFNPEAAALDAGRIMLQRLAQLAEARAHFAFETTLASRTFARDVRTWKSRLGYRFQLFFLYLGADDVAVRRVAQRVRQGGHNVPEETIRRRYDRGLRNFFQLYLPLTDGWEMYDNSVAGSPQLVARGDASSADVTDAPLWTHLKETYGQ